MIAREWLERGRSAQSSIDAFTDFWRGFNALYGTPQKIAELKKVQAYLVANISPDVAAALLSANAESVDYLLSKPVTDMRRNGKDTSSAIATFHGSNEPSERLGALFAIIYQVRCNLQHGQKSPRADRDLHLCRASAPLVAAVIELSV